MTFEELAGELAEGFDALGGSAACSMSGALYSNSEAYGDWCAQATAACSTSSGNLWAKQTSSTSRGRNW